MVEGTLTSCATARSSTFGRSPHAQQTSHLAAGGVRRDCRVGPPTPPPYQPPLTFDLIARIVGFTGTPADTLHWVFTPVPGSVVTYVQLPKPATILCRLACRRSLCRPCAEPQLPTAPASSRRAPAEEVEAKEHASAAPYSLGAPLAAPLAVLLVRPDATSAHHAGVTAVGGPGHRRTERRCCTLSPHWHSLYTSSARPPIRCRCVATHSHRGATGAVSFVARDDIASHQHTLLKAPTCGTG